MSSILEALRRSERERQQRDGKDPASLIASHLADTAMPVLSQPLSRHQRTVLVCIGLVAGVVCTAGVLLWWHSHTPVVQRPAERLAEPTVAVAAMSDALAPADPLLIDGRQVLPLPRLDTESVNLAELSQAATIAEAGNQPLTAPWLDDAISPDDILPTPPLPTDPVRKPLASGSNTSNSNIGARVQPSSRQQLGAAAAMRTDKLDLSGVSPELALAFRSALDADSASNGIGNSTRLQPLPSSPKANVATTNTLLLPNLTDLPAASRKMIPTLRFQVHNFVSDPKKRWVKFNGNVYREGAKLADSVVLKRIEAGQVVLSVRGQEATLNALQDWI
ncbi:MAG: general secretion pathway protein GspB [Plesiomonas sp.]